MIKCKICGRTIHPKAFPSHLKSHQLTREEYALKFPGELNYNPCPICGTMTWGKTCSIKCNGIRNGKLAIETGRMCGDKNPLRNANNVKKLIDTRTKNILSGVTKHPRLGKKLSDDSKSLMSKKALLRSSSKGYVNPMQGKKHTPEALKKIFSKKPMNLLEKKVAEKLDSMKIDYVFQFFITTNGICKSYDFKIKDKPILIEIDGDYWHGGPGVSKYHYNINETKVNDQFKNELAKNNGYMLIRFWESEINQNINVIDSIKQYL